MGIASSSDRRQFLRTMLTAAGTGVASMGPVFAAAPANPGVYERLGVQPLVNAGEPVDLHNPNNH